MFPIDLNKHSENYTTLDCIRKLHSKIKKNKTKKITAVQIGANSGYDDFTDIIKTYPCIDINLIICIEPLIKYNKVLKECYEDYNLVIENIFINTDENSIIQTFYTCERDWLSSVSKQHIVKHQVVEDSEISQVTVNALTINKLFYKYNISHLDLLFIDAEGMDDQIIMNIDFNKFIIDRIVYENLHIDNSKLEFFLESKGYIIKKNVYTQGVCNEAIKTH